MALRDTRLGEPNCAVASENACASRPSARRSPTAPRTRFPSPLVPDMGRKYPADPASTSRRTIRLRSSSTNAWEGTHTSEAKPRLKRLMVSTRKPSATPHLPTSRRRNWSPCRTVGTSATASAKGSASYNEAKREMMASVLPEPGPPIMRVGLGMGGFYRTKARCGTWHVRVPLVFSQLPVRATDAAAKG